MGTNYPRDDDEPTERQRLAADESDSVADVEPPGDYLNEFPRSNINSSNLAIQNWAAEAGVPADRFVDELEARL